jgi:hypothetical protein
MRPIFRDTHLTGTVTQPVPGLRKNSSCLQRPFFASLRVQKNREVASIGMLAEQITEVATRVTG